MSYSGWPKYPYGYITGEPPYRYMSNRRWPKSRANNFSPYQESQINEELDSWETASSQTRPCDICDETNSSMHDPIQRYKGRYGYEKIGRNKGCSETLGETLKRYLGNLVEVFTEAPNDVICPQDRIGILKCVTPGVIGISPVQGPPSRRVFFSLREVVGFQVGPLLPPSEPLDD